MWEGLPELWVEPLVSCNEILGRDYILFRDQTPCREGFFFFASFCRDRGVPGGRDGELCGGVCQGNY